MTSESGTGTDWQLSPDEAFGMLGNDTRVKILQELGDASEPLSFTELRNRVGIRQGTQFNYHLEKVVGHFVGKTETGYILRQPGRRVVQAILSGAMTRYREVDTTRIDETCWWCGAPMEVCYRQGYLELYCTECDGSYGGLDARQPLPTDTPESVVLARQGYLGHLALPPAGVADRTPEEIYRAAALWEILEYVAIANDLCPRCSGMLDTSVRVCEQHDDGTNLCDTCESQFAVRLHAGCRNCIYQNIIVFFYSLFTNSDFLAFLVTNGMSPLASDSLANLLQSISPIDEEIISTDPFEGAFTFTHDEERITVRVNDELEVVSVT